VLIISNNYADVLAREDGTNGGAEGAYRAQSPGSPGETRAFAAATASAATAAATAAASAAQQAPAYVLHPSSFSPPPPKNLEEFEEEKNKMRFLLHHLLLLLHVARRSYQYATKQTANTPGRTGDPCILHVYRHSCKCFDTYVIHVEYVLFLVNLVSPFAFGGFHLCLT
jgi:hypothetical protein